MQLGNLCNSFTINLPLRKLVLLSKEMVLPSHSYSYHVPLPPLDQDNPLEWLFSPMGHGQIWIFILFFFLNLVLTHENHSYKTKHLSLDNVIT